MVFSLQLAHSTRSLGLFTRQETITNPRTFGIESTTSTRLRCQSLSLNSDTIGSTGYSRIPQGLLPRSPKPVALRIKPDTSSSVQGPQVRFETRSAEQTASGQRFVTLRSTRAFRPVTPSPSSRQTTALFMSCSPSLLNLIPDSQALQANVGILRPDQTETNIRTSSRTQRATSANFLVGQTSSWFL